jgi:hypothetical protein
MNHELKRIMKRTVCLFAASLIALLFAAPATAATLVFLLGGQSNMAGLGGYNGYLGNNQPPWTNPPYDRADLPCPAPYNQPLDAVKFWNYTPDAVSGSVHNPSVGNGWISLQNNYGYRNDTFGPELSFGARLHEFYPNDEIYLVKTGISGTTLGGDWNPTSGATYNLFKSRTTAALNSLAAKNPTIAGMIWMQGESDAATPSYATNYAANLKNFVNKVRTTFNAPNMKFVAGEITNMSVVALGATQANTDLVRNSQANISSQIANSSSFNTDDLTWAYYGHYGTQGQIELGNRFAAQFAPVPEPSTWVLIGTAFFGAIGFAWRKRKR